MFYGFYRRGTVWGAVVLALLIAATAAPTVWFFTLSDQTTAKDAFGEAAWQHGISPANMQRAFREGPLGLAELDNLLSAAFLHVSYGHLAFNLVPLVPLGWMTLRRVGTGGFACLWLLGLCVTGLLYSMAGGFFTNMIGASGGTHWLMGLWIGWAMTDRRGGYFRRVWPSVALLAVALAANGAVFALRGADFAWDLHLLGLLSGMAFAPFIPARQPDTGFQPQPK